MKYSEFRKTLDACFYDDEEIFIYEEDGRLYFDREPHHVIRNDIWIQSEARAMWHEYTIPSKYAGDEQ